MRPKKRRFRVARGPIVIRYTLLYDMLSFRTDDSVAREAGEWAERLGVDRSEILRDALRRYLAALASEWEAEAWERAPLDAGEESLAGIADWGPAEDWSDWSDETG